MADTCDHGLLLSSAQVCEMVGCSFRQLDYWSREGMLDPTLPASGFGSWRRWSTDDAAFAAVCKYFSDWGVKGDRLRVIMGQLRADPALWREMILIRVDGTVVPLRRAGDLDGLRLDLSAVRAGLGERPAPRLAALA